MNLPIDSRSAKFVKVDYADPALDRCREKLNDEYHNDGFMRCDNQSRLISTSVDVHHNPKRTDIKSSQKCCLILASRSGYLSMGSIYFPKKEPR